MQKNNKYHGFIEYKWMEQKFSKYFPDLDQVQESTSVLDWSLKVRDWDSYLVHLLNDR